MLWYAADGHLLEDIGWTRKLFKWKRLSLEAAAAILPHTVVFDFEVCITPVVRKMWGCTRPSYASSKCCFQPIAMVFLGVRMGVNQRGRLSGPWVGGLWSSKPVVLSWSCNSYAGSVHSVDVCFPSATDNHNSVSHFAWNCAFYLCSLSS